jgi:thiol-disulfide isomerase/thioredoxin
MQTKSIGSMMLALGLGLALVVVIGLVRRLGEFRRDFADLRRVATLPQAGGYVPTVRLATLGGDSIAVGEPGPGRRQVLLVFTTTCPFCRATLPVWDRMVDSVRRVAMPIDIVGVSLDSAALADDYARLHALPFPVATMTEARHRFLFRAGAVPQTLVVGSGGRIRYATTGRLTEGAVLDSVYRALLGPADSMELAYRGR